MIGCFAEGIILDTMASLLCLPPAGSLSSIGNSHSSLRQLKSSVEAKGLVDHQGVDGGEGVVVMVVVSVLSCFGIDT